jgi:hypothetical protein
MDTLGLVLQGVGGLLNLVGFFVLFKLFQKEGFVKALMGFICMLYTFYWGWQNRMEQNLTNVMWAWVAGIVLSVIGGVLAGMGASQVAPEMRLLF